MGEVQCSLLTSLSLENYNEPEVVDVLANDPCQIFSVSSDGLENSPLHIACLYGNLSATRLLLMHGACVHARNAVEETPLHALLSSDKGYYVHYETFLDILFKHGADFNAVDKHGSTPLHCALSTQEGEEDVVRRLARYGANIDAADDAGNTPLILAVKESRCRRANLLVGLGANLSLRDKRGRTALHWAALRRHDHVGRILVENGADMDIQDKNGATPAYLTAAVLAEAPRGADGLLEYLVRKGANLHLKTKSGNTVLTHLISRPQLEGLVRQVIKSGCMLPRIVERQYRLTTRHSSLVQYYFLIRHAWEAVSFVKCSTDTETLQPTIPLPPELVVHIYSYLTGGFLKMPHLDLFCKLAFFAEREGKVNGEILNCVIHRCTPPGIGKTPP